MKKIFDKSLAALLGAAIAVLPTLTSKVASQDPPQLFRLPSNIKSRYISSTKWPVLLIHGFKNGYKGSGTDGWDCHNYFEGDAGGVIRYLRGSHQVNHTTLRWRGSITTIGYYTGDTNCDASLQSQASRCVGYFDSNSFGTHLTGTHNEDIKHLGCELAWYIWNNYTSKGQNVQIVAHSMGGLITRWALYATQFDPKLPPYLLVQDVITFDTPHGGVPTAFYLIACVWDQKTRRSDCQQSDELLDNSDFIHEMHDGSEHNGLHYSGQNPQGAGPGTDWTMIGQGCDEDPVDYHTATYMSGGHKVTFVNYHPCYGHGGFVTDWGPGSNQYPDSSNGDTQDADILWCDECAANPSLWQYWNTAPHALRLMLIALYLPDW